MSQAKELYISPKITKYSSISELPEALQTVVAEHLTSGLAVILDDHRVYQLVSPQFAKLLGYESDELKGKRIDDVTPKGTVNIDFIFNAFLKLGEMEGLWLFQDRQGKNLLFHYHARLLQDHLMCAELEPLPLAG